MPNLTLAYKYLICDVPCALFYCPYFGVNVLIPIIIVIKEMNSKQMKNEEGTGRYLNPKIVASRRIQREISTPPPIDHIEGATRRIKTKPALRYDSASRFHFCTKSDGSLVALNVQKRSRRPAVPQRPASAVESGVGDASAIAQRRPRDSFYSYVEHALDTMKGAQYKRSVDIRKVCVRRKRR